MPSFTFGYRLESFANVCGANCPRIFEIRPLLNLIIFFRIADAFDFADIVREAQHNVSASAGSFLASPTQIDGVALLARARALSDTYAARGMRADLGLLMSALEGEFGQGILTYRARISDVLADVQRSAPPRPASPARAAVAIDDSDDDDGVPVQPRRSATSAQPKPLPTRDTPTSQPRRPARAPARAQPSYAEADSDASGSGGGSDDDIIVIDESPVKSKAKKKASGSATKEAVNAVVGAKATKTVKPPQGLSSGAAGASAKPADSPREKAAEQRGVGEDAPLDDAHARAPKHSSTLQLTLPKKLKSCSTLLVQIEDPTFDLSGTFVSPRPRRPRSSVFTPRSLPPTGSLPLGPIPYVVRLKVMLVLSAALQSSRAQG